MKTLRLLRWSGSVPPIRTRPCCVHQSYRSPAYLRFQSSAGQSLQQSDQYQEEGHAEDEYQELEGTPEPKRQGPWGSQDDHFKIPKRLRRKMPNHLVEEARLRVLPSPPISKAKSSTKLAALHARLALSPRLPIETLARCLIDSTADPHTDFNNASLALLGKDLCDYYTTEAILCRYPRLPSAVLTAAISAYVGPRALTQITKEWGVEIVAEPGGEVDMGYLQCKRKDSMLVECRSATSDDDPRAALERQQPKIVSTDTSLPGPEKGWNRGAKTVPEYDSGESANRNREQTKKVPVTSVEDACARFVQAVMGAVYLHRGRYAAKMFFKEHITSRHLDVGKLFEFWQPTRDLSKLCQREGFESPVARILSETGRRSRSPVFVVGVFAGREKLGEGAGSSLNEARTRAAVGALKGWYLYSPLEVRVPSDAEGPNAKPWQPVLVDIGEVIC